MIKRVKMLILFEKMLNEQIFAVILDQEESLKTEFFSVIVIYYGWLGKKSVDLVTFGWLGEVPLALHGPDTLVSGLVNQ